MKSKQRNNKKDGVAENVSPLTPMKRLASTAVPLRSEDTAAWKNEPHNFCFVQCCLATAEMTYLERGIIFTHF